MILVLERSCDPLVFWCHALIFVVDCLNHIAKKPLGWKTSSEVLNGDTADFSPFRFKFGGGGQLHSTQLNSHFLNLDGLRGDFWVLRGRLVIS